MGIGFGGWGASGRCCRHGHGRVACFLASPKLLKCSSCTRQVCGADNRSTTTPTPSPPRPRAPTPTQAFPYDPRPSLTSYTVTVHTSKDIKGAGTDATVSIIMYGADGESGVRHLEVSCHCTAARSHSPTVQADPCCGQDAGVMLWSGPWGGSCPAGRVPHGSVQAFRVLRPFATSPHKERASPPPATSPPGEIHCGCSSACASW